MGQENNQQTNNVPVFSADELAAKWSALLNQAIMANLTLEKQILSQIELIQNLTANEVGLVNRIEDLETALKKCRDVMSPASAQTNSDGRDVIQENQKTTPHVQGGS